MLNLSQPTVSHHFRSLEADMGVKSFNRDDPYLKLKETGIFLLPLSRKLVRSIIYFKELVALFKIYIIGYLRITYSTTPGKYFLTRLAGRFRQYLPGVNISILWFPQEDITQKLVEGNANLGVGSYETRGKLLEIQEFFIDHIFLIITESHIRAVMKSIAPDDFVEKPLILPEPQYKELFEALFLYP